MLQWKDLAYYIHSFFYKMRELKRMLIFTLQEFLY